MQINLSANLNAGEKIRGEAPLSLSLADFSGGESLTARVIFSAGQTAHLKTAAGELIRARLEGGVTLPEGSEVTLTVADKSAGAVFLRVADMQTRESAAILAAQAAAAASASGTAPRPAGLAQLLAELSALLLPESAASMAEGANFIRNIFSLPPATENTAPPSSAVVINAEASAPANVLPMPAIADMPAPPNAPAMPAIAEAPASVNPPAMPAIAEAPAPANVLTMPATTVNAPAPAPTNAPTTPAGAPAITINHLRPGNINNEQEFTQNSKLTAQNWSTKQSTSLEIQQLARQITAELYPAGQKDLDQQTLAAFIGRLFARRGATAEQSGAELQKSARELTARLESMHEAIERSSLPQKEALLGQSARILQQSETAQQPERLICLQIPVQLAQNRQAAELYVYHRERKGGRKLDPQNATIMLALNTEHLGRLEAMIQTRGKEIRLNLEIARAEAVPFMREQSGALFSLLAEAGFKLTSASVSPLKRETHGPQAAVQALETFRRGAGRGFDVII